MEKKHLLLLKKIYHHENGFYNSEADRHETKIPESVTLHELTELKNIGLKPNNFETFEHDNALERLLKFQSNKKVNIEFVIAFFYKGITGEIPRGRQPLMSYLFIIHLKQHKFVGKKHCEICGLHKKETIDKTASLYTKYLGHSWNEIVVNYLIDLEEIQKFEKPEVTITDRNTLINFLKFIELAELNESPGKLEKRISSNNMLAKTDKYKRYGILETISECGILPNNFIKPRFEEFTTPTERFEASEKLTTSHRSDIVLPFGAWKGELGVNWKRYEEIFGK